MEKKKKKKKTLKTSENQDLSDVLLETLAWITISSWFFFNVYGFYLSTMWEPLPGNLTSFFLVPC